MSLALSFHGFTSGQTDVRSSVPLPIVYENVPVPSPHWEYRVLTIDPREEALPDAARLNELGNQGWLLVGMIEQTSNERGGPVHFYFVRQKME